MHDEAVIELFFARDERAIAEVRKEYGAICERAARELLADRLAAEECFADALMALWNNIPPERPVSLKAYALCITKRCALKAYRERSAARRGGGLRVESLDELESCLPSRENDDPGMEARALSELMNRWLGEQRAEDRALFLKRYWFGESVSEIAHEFGESALRVSHRLALLRKKLKEYLEKEGFSV